MSKKNDKLYKKSLGKPTDSTDYRKYITQRNNFMKLKRQTKQTYYTNLLDVNKHYSRKTWSILNTLIGRKSHSPISDTFKNENNETISDRLVISKAFCKYFTEIGRTLASKIPPPKKAFHKHMKNKLNINFFMHPTDPVEIRKTISSLKPKTSYGHDNISSKLIKLFSNSLSTPLSIIINQSLKTGTVPISWKLAKVIPIYKSKEKANMNNYRPISLLPSLSKILEKIVHHRLYNFCKAQNILNSKQFGFRPNHSTVHAITNFIANVQASTEQNHFTVAVLLDLSKSFDTIAHNILLSKLEHYGVRGLPLEWFRSYLAWSTAVHHLHK